MVERTARALAIDAIRRFRDGELTNDEFVDAFPGSRSDPAVRAVAGALWFFYDDLSVHKLEGTHALSPENVRGFNRCIVFLATDEEYVPKPGPLRRLAAAILKEALPSGTSKHSPVWPFASWDSYRKAVEDLGRDGADTRGVQTEYECAMEEIESAGPRI